MRLLTLLLSLSFLLAFSVGLPLNAKELPAALPKQLPAPDQKPPAKDKPVKVYILSGQSNMVGIGQISGGGTRWSGVTDATVSVYEGAYDPAKNYDELKPITTKKLDTYGGTKPTPFPGGGTQVVRGFIELKTSGVYEFRPGYQGSETNIMELDGVEVHRREPGKASIFTGHKVTAGKKMPFKITFLTKAADGLGWFTRTDIPGTLQTVVHADKKFPHLIDAEGRWAERNDVWYKGLVTATANQWLGPGCGANKNSIGPELQFGHVLGTYHDEPVIVLKTSQGNRSLGWDFLPPGSERFDFEGRTYAGYKDDIPSWSADDPGKKVNWYAGLQYDQCFDAAKEYLAEFGTNFPQWKDQGYEIAGFVWWQGHKDGNAAHASRYEQNLVHLIKTLRKDFDAPKAPFVIGTIGFDGWDMAGPHVDVAKAQLAVSGTTGTYPDFAGNVLTVETRDFWKDHTISPRNQGFHYNGNAETYMMVGDVLGRGMVELLNGGGKPKNDKKQGAVPEQPDAKKAQPNVVIFLTDDQGTLDVNCYGSKDLYTPTMDRLAANGVRFTEATAHIFCCPTRAMLLTGRYPQRSNVNHWTQGNTKDAEKGRNMHLEEITIAEMLKPAGYRTGLFGKWHLGAHVDHGPKRQGFDEFFGHRSGFIDNYNHHFLHGSGFHDLYEGTTEVFKRGNYFPDLMTDRACAFVDRNQDQPFFLYVPFNLPHYPEQAYKEFDERYKNLPEPRRTYAKVISTTDALMGRVMARLDQHGLTENTIVIFMSDNGHSAEDYKIRGAEHSSGLAEGANYGANGGGGNTGKWRGHKGQFFEGGARVPAIISWPAQLPKGEVRGQTITAMDWLPTIADLAGVPAPEVKLDGASLRSIIASDSAPTHNTELHWGWNKIWAVRQGDWKLIHRSPKDRQLVSLADEKPESKNHAAEKPQIVARLQALHDAWAASVTPEQK